MGYLRVAYVTQDLRNPDKEYKRDIESFPLKIGKYRLKKHPLFSFWLLKYEHNTLSFSVKDIIHSVKVNQYMYFTYKKTHSKQIDIFFEIMDEEWVDETSEEKAQEEQLTPSLESIPGALLKIHSEVSEQDAHSNGTFEKDYELPAVLNANTYISTVEGDLVVKRIISEDEILMSVTGHYGKEILVTTGSDGVYSAGDSYGYNDHFRAFSCKLTIKLVKK